MLYLGTALIATECLDGARILSDRNIARLASLTPWYPAHRIEILTDFGFPFGLGTGISQMLDPTRPRAKRSIE